MTAAVTVGLPFARRSRRFCADPSGARHRNHAGRDLHRLARAAHHRRAGALVRRPAAPPAAAGQDSALPVYSVITALYQEASSVDGLLSAIERLD